MNRGRTKKVTNNTEVNTNEEEELAKLTSYGASRA